MTLSWAGTVGGRGLTLDAELGGYGRRSGLTFDAELGGCALAAALRVGG